MIKKHTISPQQSLSLWKKIFFYATLYVGFPILLFLVMEVFVRFTLPETDLLTLTGRALGANPMREWAVTDAFCAFRPRPGQYKRKKYNKTVNSCNFISTPEINVKKNADTIRIVFMGGSSTAGTGANIADEDTWPWQTISMLKEKYKQKNIEFINAAAGGYMSFMSYGRLWSRIRFFSPDIVIIYHGWNDMYYFNDIDNMHKLLTLPDGSWSFDSLPAPVPFYKPLLIDYVLFPSQLLSRLRLKLTKPISGEAPTDVSLTPLKDSYDQRGIDIWRTNLRLFRETAKILGVKLFVAKQASLIAPGLPAEYRDRCTFKYHGFDFAAHIDAYKNMYKVIDDELMPNEIIDTTLISGKPEYFYDSVHPTELGCQKLAAIVSSSLLAYLTQTGNEQNNSIH